MKEKIKNFIGFLKKHKKKTAVIITVLVLVFLLFPRKYEWWVTDGGSHYWGYESPVYNVMYYFELGGELGDEERPVYEGMKVSVFGRVVYRK